MPQKRFSLNVEQYLLELPESIEGLSAEEALKLFSFGLYTPQRQVIRSVQPPSTTIDKMSPLWQWVGPSGITWSDPTITKSGAAGLVRHIMVTEALGKSSGRHSFSVNIIASSETPSIWIGVALAGTEVAIEEGSSEGFSSNPDGYGLYSWNGIPYNNAVAASGYGDAWKYKAGDTIVCEVDIGGLGVRWIKNGVEGVWLYPGLSKFLVPYFSLFETGTVLTVDLSGW